jgi:SEC-C motif domain protein
VKQLQGDQPCPCGRLDAKERVLTYEQCCRPCLESGQNAVDAVSLMRSRYTAFVLEHERYLLSTWHMAHRPAGVDFDLQAKWLGLEVRASRLHDGEHAEVEFVARNRVVGRAVRLHERSRFVKEDGRWYYVDGKHEV